MCENEFFRFTLLNFYQQEIKYNACKGALQWPIFGRYNPGKNSNFAWLE